MRVFILFSTTEGHARKVAQFAAARLTKLDHEVCGCDAAKSDQPDLAGFDAALLIASVHVGHYRRSVELEFYTGPPPEIPDTGLAKVTSPFPRAGDPRAALRAA